uniref:Uncharacterized protein n=1 Tax=Otus sunia TaxID=257818 RepID=A0A8C8E7H2_9STRI
MPRSFLVDSLVLREAGEKKGEGSPPPPLFPYAVHPSHPLPALPAGACHARKAGLLCVCPLCVTASQLHPPPPAIPLIKASFPPFGSQYCHSPLARQQHSVSDPADGTWGGGGPARRPQAGRGVPAPLAAAAPGGRAGEAPLLPAEPPGRAVG